MVKDKNGLDDYFERKVREHELKDTAELFKKYPALKRAKETIDFFKNNVEATAYLNESVRLVDDYFCGRPVGGIVEDNEDDWILWDSSDDEDIFISKYYAEVYKVIEKGREARESGKNVYILDKYKYEVIDTCSNQQIDPPIFLVKLLDNIMNRSMGIDSKDFIPYYPSRKRHRVSAMVFPKEDNVEYLHIALISTATGKYEIINRAFKSSYATNINGLTVQVWQEVTEGEFERVRKETILHSILKEI